MTYIGVLVPTMHPPAMGAWLCRDDVDIVKIDAAIHHWSINTWVDYLNGDTRKGLFAKGAFQ